MTNVLAGVGVLEARLGIPTDTMAAGSVFGRLAAISNTLVGIRGNSAEAASKARSATTAAQGAMGAVSGLKSDIGGGRLDSAVAMLTEIRGALHETQSDVQDLAKVDVAVALKEAAQKISEIAKNTTGIDQFIKTSAPTKPVDGDAVLQLNKNIAEMKASVELIGRLMDETVNKPLYVEWLEGGK